MTYVKIIKNDTVIAVEAHTLPVYVYRQPNGVLVRCSELKAQGILSMDGSVIYQLEGSEQLDDARLIASVITTAEYLNLIESLDETPNEEDNESSTEIDGEVSSEPVMTTVEMRRRILSLEEELTATKILLGVE